MPSLPLLPPRGRRERQDSHNSGDAGGAEREPTPAFVSCIVSESAQDSWSMVRNFLLIIVWHCQGMLHCTMDDGSVDACVDGCTSYHGRERAGRPRITCFSCMIRPVQITTAASTITSRKNTTAKREHDLQQPKEPGRRRRIICAGAPFFFAFASVLVSRIIHRPVSCRSY